MRCIGHLQDPLCKQLPLCKAAVQGQNLLASVPLLLFHILAESP